VSIKSPKAGDDGIGGGVMSALWLVSKEHMKAIYEDRTYVVIRLDCSWCSDC